MNRKVSIIIRTKNEERWITQCLRSVFEQEMKAFEVILVDNLSSDKTVEKAKQLGVTKVMTCDEYLPGKALNLGIKGSTGEFIVCLSGHCIPVDNKWLTNLLRNFSNPEVAGVYGRQEPMEFTSDADKRDLSLVFGLDRKEQLKDSFFHNANSMVRRSVWNEIPFDDTVTNIEDRVWAKAVLSRGHRIIYEPEASVYHYHGIHQNGDADRCSNVVRIMEDIHPDYEYKSLDIGRMNTVAIVPVKGPIKHLGGKSLLAYTVERALGSKYIKKVVVSTDSHEVEEMAKKLGAEVPFLRDASFSGPHIDLGRVFGYSLEKMEEKGIFADMLVCLEITFPFRPKDLIDDMIIELARRGLDSVVASRVENRALWRERDGQIEQVTEGITPRQFKEPAFVELKGVGCVTHPAFLRKGHLLGPKVGMYELTDPYSHLEVRSDEDLRMASLLVKAVF